MPGIVMGFKLIFTVEVLNVGYDNNFTAESSGNEIDDKS
jgi:hypothetical protein